MTKRILLILTLLPILLTACAAAGGGIDSRPNVFVDPAQAPPAVTMEERVVTMIPAGTVVPPGTPVPGGTTVPKEALPATPVIDEQARETAVANLRALLNAPDLELALKAVESSPNASNYPALLFVDPNVNSYYVSQDTLQPIEFTITQPFRPADGPAKSPEALRASAERIAAAHSTRFAELRSRLTYTEGTKGENNFFRWELPGSDVGMMPAILQIGLKQDGTLFAYLNSIDLVE